MKVLNVDFGNAGQRTNLDKLKTEFDIIRKRYSDGKKFLELITTKIAGDNSYIYKLMGFDGFCHVVYAPTQNCQFFSFSKFNQLITMGRNYFPGYLEELRAFLSDYLYEVIVEVNKPMFLVDINQQYLQETKAIFNPYTELVFETPYHSTNGSTMVMIMFKKVPKNTAKKLENLAKEVPRPLSGTTIAF